MKRKVKLGIFLFVVIIGSLVFYFFFPQIWGEAIYPLAYEDLIKKYSKRFELSPTLVAAVIYSESRFNPEATSRAGARGLMQVMPSTGRGIARGLGEDFSVTNLYDPETSIRYGCYYLRDLSDRYDNNVDLVLAGYNGGPAVATRWLEARVAPVGETAGYVNKVKKTEQMYAQIYTDQLHEPEQLEIQLRVESAPEPFWQRFLKGIYNSLFQ